MIKGLVTSGSPEALQLWQRHPLFLAHEALKSAYVASRHDMNSSAYRAYDGWNPIPDLDNATLADRAKYFSAALVKENGLRPVLDKDLRGIAFTWSKNLGDLIQPEQLQHIRSFVTLHRNGHPSLFKPSVAEVLAQMPSEMLVEGMRGVFVTDSISDNVYETSTGMNMEYHVAITNAFALKP